MNNANRKRYYLSAFALLIFSAIIHAQGPEDPPRPVSVSVTQNLSFGSFYQGATGGSVTVTPAGSRSAGGDVVLISLGSFTPARYEFTGNPGTVITLTLDNDVTLVSAGGGSMSVTLGPTNPVSPFVMTNPYPVAFILMIGGTLNVGTPASNPPGSYSGTFDIIFNQN